MVPAEGYVTTRDGIRLFFQTVGQGPQTVVIPNGFHLLEDFAPLAKGRTLVFYDVRNRGRSDHVEDASKLRGGIQNDIDDLDVVRQHFGISRLDAIGHSYLGRTIVLYAMTYPAHVNRLVQVGPMEPKPGRQYPRHLTGADATTGQVFARLAELQKEPRSADPTESCRKFWSVMRVIYVTDPADADRIHWGRCDLPNERNFMKYWTEHIMPSIQRADVTPATLATVTTPILTIHGTKDRSAPYGGAREWALLLPNARLVAVEHAGHAPWIEAPSTVFDAIATFLDGRWPESAVKVETLDPAERIE